MHSKNFRCVLTDWNYMYNLCQILSKKVKESKFEPNIIVALARGGWFAGRVLCDFLDLKDLVSLKMEHYVGAAITGDCARVKYLIDDTAVKGKSILVVDDITDTGKSINGAKEYLLAKDPKEIKISVLQCLYTSKAKTDYYGEYLKEWVWIIYPWNFIEDMIDIISKMMREKERRWNMEDIRRGLRDHYQIDPISFEIIQPNRLGEVIREMVDRKILKFEGGKYEANDG
ncbi:MAG: xanthine-guanine phosphoribosyltransferase [Candidatus Methanolliviera sp. GoM_asphalt]|nr:MAG: xanthine-guanine phosphoribosyltransferase [Candidatus Methanolliviera sp. GoM_asphalt]